MQKQLHPWLFYQQLHVCVIRATMRRLTEANPPKSGPGVGLLLQESSQPNILLGSYLAYKS